MPSVCVEDSLKVDIHRMVSHVFANERYSYAGQWQLSRDGEYTNSISYTVLRLEKLSGRLTLKYSAHGEAVHYCVSLVAVPCRFGGLRWFAICPRTGLKASKLYLPPGAKHFYARQAWRIAYKSQNVAKGFSTICHRRQKILVRHLKNADPIFPQRPKWMRRKTYEAHCNKLHQYDVILDAVVTRFLDRRKLR